jgi:hypothetical protein
VGSEGNVEALSETIRRHLNQWFITIFYNYPLISQLTGRGRIASVLIRPAPLDFDGGTASRSGRVPETEESPKNP